MHYCPNYYPEDVHRLFAAIPCLRLAKPAGARGYLEAAVEAGAELSATLAQYPHVRYRHLDFQYVCLQSLAALDEKLLQDLVSDHHWPGIVWGSLLASLSPRPEFAPILLSALPRAGHHQAWWVELALSIVTGERSKDSPDHEALLRTLSAQLQALPRLATRLRVVPALPLVLERSSRVRAAYVKGGADAALEVLRRNPL
jgi:hypothetical protein